MPKERDLLQVIAAMRVTTNHTNNTNNDKTVSSKRERALFPLFYLLFV